MELKVPTTDAAAQQEAQTSPEAQEQHQKQGGFSRALDALSLLVLLSVIFSFAQTTYRVRHQPWDLAFVLFMYSMLALLFCCLKKFERLTPDSPVESRERLKFSVWLVSTVLSFAFAWRVAEIMTFAMKVVIWTMTSSVMVVGFYGLFIHKEEEYCKLQNSDHEDMEKSFHELSPEEKV